MTLKQVKQVKRWKWESYWPAEMRTLECQEWGPSSESDTSSSSSDTSSSSSDTSGSRFWSTSMSRLFRSRFRVRTFSSLKPMIITPGEVHVALDCQLWMCFHFNLLSSNIRQCLRIREMGSISTMLCMHWFFLNRRDRSFLYAENSFEMKSPLPKRSLKRTVVGSWTNKAHFPSKHSPSKGRLHFNVKKILFN